MPPKKVPRKQLVERVRYWREKLGLHDWAIAVEYKRLNLEEDGRAHCSAMPEYREATLRFDSRPGTVTPENLDALCIHELLHCHVWSLAHVAETFAGNNAKHLEWSRTEEEGLVTRLERVILALTRTP